MLIFPAAMCFFFTARCFLTTAILLNEHKKNPSTETVLGFLYAALFVYIYQIPAQIILLPKDLTLYASVVSYVSRTPNVCYHTAKKCVRRAVYVNFET